MALRLRGATSGYIELKAPASAGDNTLTLPVNNGSANQLLKTDGSGNLSWTNDNSGVSLSGSTNNTIATVTGANALAGEANLTFDGAKLTVTSASKDLLYLNSTHSDGLQIPLQSNGTDFAYFGSAKTLFSGGSVTDLGFRVATNICFGIGASEKVRIDSSGRLLVAGTASGDVHSDADDVVIGNTSASLAGLSIATSTSGYATLNFSDGAGDKNQGMVAYNHSNDTLNFSTASTKRLVIDSSGRFLKGVNSSEGSRSNTSVRQPHFQLSSPWSSGLGSTSITCTDDYPIIFINSNATYQDNAGAGVLTFSVKDGAGNYCNTASIRSQIDGTPGNNDSPGELSFRVTADGSCQPTERLKIHSNGNTEINDGDLIIGTAGHGIDFSAHAHDGGMTSELFDDYEEGTWTPGTTNADFSTRTGWYTKVGRLVHLQLKVEGGSNFNGSNAVYITGLPYTNAANKDAVGIAMFYKIAFASGYTDLVTPYVQGGGNNIYFMRQNSGSGSGNYLQADAFYTSASIEVNIMMFAST